MSVVRTERVPAALGGNEVSDDEFENLLRAVFSSACSLGYLATSDPTYPATEAESNRADAAIREYVLRLRAERDEARADATRLESPMLEVKLTKTCGACPEQYDAYVGTHRVGYLRLRHGYFYAACPWVGGTVVYEADTNGDGCFDDNERDEHLEAAKAAILKWRNEHKDEVLC